jgi:hypothetical protein
MSGPPVQPESLQTADTVRYGRVHFDATATWHRQDSFAFVGEVTQVALSDSELLLSSHHLPIAIDYVDDRLQVVAITAPQFQRTPLVDDDGQWRRAYTPIALRCLPFRLATNDTVETLEIAVSLPGRGEAAFPVLNADGTTTNDIKQIIALLRRLEAGKKRLQAAAEKLLIADVLAPFQMVRAPGAKSVRSRMLTVDRNKFASLSNRRASHIARDDFLAIDLVAACLFSQRLVPGPISVAAEPRAAGEGDDLQAGQPQDFRPSAQIDDSELFSFELFSKAGNHDDKNG